MKRQWSHQIINGFLLIGFILVAVGGLNAYAGDDWLSRLTSDDYAIQHAANEEALHSDSTGKSHCALILAQEIDGKTSTVPKSKLRMPFVCDVLAGLGPNARIAVPALIAQFKKSPEVTDRRAIMDALSKIGATGDSVPFFIQELGDAQSLEASDAVDALSRLETPSADAVQALLHLLPSARFKMSVAQTLSVLRPWNESATATLRMLQGSSNARNRLCGRGHLGLYFS